MKDALNTTTSGCEDSSPSATTPSHPPKADWRSRRELEASLVGLMHLEALHDLYCLSTFYRQAIFRHDYQSPAHFATAITFTDDAETIIRKCIASTGFPEPDVRLAAFGHFYHHDILIDWEHTSRPAILAALTDDLLNDRIRYALWWGRELYDKFADLPALGEPNHLENEQVWSLLDDLPKGVFQHGRFVSGPHGFLTSTE